MMRRMKRLFPFCFKNNTTGQYLSIKRVISRKTAQIIKVSIYYDEIDCNIKHIEQAGVADYNKFILETLGLTKKMMFSQTSFFLSTNIRHFSPVLIARKKKSLIVSVTV